MSLTVPRPDQEGAAELIASPFLKEKVKTHTCVRARILVKHGQVNCQRPKAEMELQQDDEPWKHLPTFFTPTETCRNDVCASSLALIYRFLLF